MTEPIWHNADDIRQIAELEAKLSRYEAAKDAVTRKHTRYVVLPDEGIAIIDKAELLQMEDKLTALASYEAATVVEGFKCLGCGHVYMGENVSECDCTVHNYNYERVRVLILPEEGGA